MAPSLQGPGMLWVTSRISQEAESTLDEPTFLKWYDEDHIPELVSTSGITNAFRYIDAEKGTASSSSKPFLAVYPMADLAFTQSPEFVNIRVKSAILPASGIIYDMADMDVSYLGLVGKTEGGEKKEPAQYLLVSAIEPAARASDEEVNKFYDDQLATISQTPHYLRSLRFKLQYARTNAQSRKLKGLPTTDEPHPELPTWQVVHEFSTAPTSAIQAKIKDDPSELLRSARQNEVRVYKLAKVHGGGKFFE